MGLLRSRASKQRDKAQARLLRAQRRQLRRASRAPSPTVGVLVARWWRSRRAGQL